MIQKSRFSTWRLRSKQRSCQLAYDAGYRHLNLNEGAHLIGSKTALIGACLMKHAQTVSDVIKAMQVADDVLVR